MKRIPLLKALFTRSNQRQWYTFSTTRPSPTPSQSLKIEPCASANRLKKRLQNGFTLIEVLAAVAVLAIALAAIVSGMARYADSAIHLREKTLALWLAHNRLTEITLEREWPDIGDSDGDVEFAGADWTWDVVVEETPADNVRRITVEVRRAEAGDDAPALITLASFLSDSGRTP